MPADQTRGSPRRGPTEVEVGGGMPEDDQPGVLATIRRAFGAGSRQREPREPDRRPGATATGNRRTRPERPPAATASTETRRRRKRTRARKVKRIVRHVDPWSTLKISVLFYLALCLIVLVAGVLLWNVARTTGTLERTEDFITDMFALGRCPSDDEADAADADDGGPVEQVAPSDEEAEDEPETTLRDCPDEELVGTFTFEGDQIFRGFVLGGLVLVLAGSVFNVVLVLLFNLISDLTGGVRFTVLEEEPPTSRPAPGAKPAAPPRAPPGARPRKGPATPPKRPPEQVATNRPRP